VVIASAPCVLQYKISGEGWSIDSELCTGCKACLRAGCTALSLNGETGARAKVAIDAAVCNGCGVCAQLCKTHAIAGPGVADGKEAR
jgi:indolepyruvate ferredoxin oxidoreductase alpha subunit